MKASLRDTEPNEIIVTAKTKDKTDLLVLCGYLNMAYPAECWWKPEGPFSKELRDNTIT